jgi:hypothetical protein
MNEHGLMQEELEPLGDVRLYGLVVVEEDCNDLVGLEKNCSDFLILEFVPVVSKQIVLHGEHEEL